MINPYRHINVENGIIFLFMAKDPVIDQPCIVQNIWDKPHLTIADYAMPIEYIRLDNDTERYTIYIMGSDFYEQEAQLLATIPLNEKTIGRILMLKDLITAT